MDLSISNIGTLMGDFAGRLSSLAKVLTFGTLIGFIISVAEPDLLILANEITSAVGLPAQAIVVIISLGVGVMLSVGIFRIFKEIPISKLMTIIYAIIFTLMIFTDDLGHAIAFDASGATTGAMTTPFIIALGLGVSKLKGEDAAEDNSFGLVGIASTGPVLAGLLMSLGLKNDSVTLVEASSNSFIYEAFISATMAILPIFLVYLIMNKAYFHEENFKGTLLGLAYTYLGLWLFLASANGGFMDLARNLGEGLSNSIFLPLVGFVFGLIVVLAEPAVYVLGEQVEEVTGGSIKKSSILKALSIGVAFAIMLAMIRIKVEAFKLRMVMVPGFATCLVLSRHIPQIFTGIAFDSGGVASGPMTATFILALCQGAAGNLAEGFGVISFVAMMPVLAIMILGYFYKEASK